MVLPSALSKMAVIKVLALSEIYRSIKADLDKREAIFFPPFHDRGIKGSLITIFNVCHFFPMF